MKFLSNKKGFLGIDNKINIKEKVIIIPFGLEKTVSYGGGTSRGPKEIIKASHQVELYDEDLNNLYKGTDNYLPADSKGFNSVNWENQMNTTMKEFSDIEFVIVGKDIHEAQLCEELKII